MSSNYADDSKALHTDLISNKYGGVVLGRWNS